MVHPDEAASLEEALFGDGDIAECPLGRGLRLSFGQAACIQLVGVQSKMSAKLGAEIG
jgi:hypothetical protein